VRDAELKSQFAKQQGWNPKLVVLVILIVWRRFPLLHK
jgi:hypothetical protein